MKINRSIYDVYNQTFKLAAESLLALTNIPFADLDSAIDTLLKCNRLIVTTGVGKSGFIAQKMAATLTSTGSPAVFLDPLDALHGDLGITSTGDVVIAISYSGETSEIIALLPTLKQRNVPVISIVGNCESSLAKASKISLHAPVTREACPLNLAPTTSTLVAMALTDALAVSLMTAKNYQAEEFALNHPAGSLGRRLTLRVSDLIDENKTKLSIPIDAPFSEVACSISASGVGAVCVTDDKLNIQGLITDGDIRRTVEKHPLEKLPYIKATDIMTKSPATVKHDILAIEALNIMEQRTSQISVLPVTDDLGLFFGIIRLHDLVRAGL